MSQGHLSAKLLNCPFCGSVPTLLQIADLIGIECGTECDETGLTVCFPADKKDTAIAAWNRRATQPQVQAAGDLDAKLNAAIAFINHMPHGDNCFVSSHYEGDPGDRCNCGKDSLLGWLESDTEQSQAVEPVAAASHQEGKK